MSEPASTYSRLTCLPCGPVWIVTRVAPSICLANSLTSATDLAMRTPPLSPAEASLNLPLPRPPAWIWLFTTQIGPPSVLAATSESEARSTGTPFEIGTPNSCSSALAWYSWMFMSTPPEPSCGEFGIHTRLAAGIPYTIATATKTAGANWQTGDRFGSIFGQSSARSAAEQIRCDLLAGIDQPLHRADRLVARLAVLAGQLDLDNALDALRSDHDGHADIHVLHPVFAVEIGGDGA